MPPIIKPYNVKINGNTIAKVISEPNIISTPETNANVFNIIISKYITPSMV